MPKKYVRRYKKKTVFRPKNTLKVTSRTIYTFTRSYTYITSGPANIVSTSYAIPFQLNLLPSATEFTTLYDSYRINYCTVRFVPDAVDSQDRSGAQIINPYMLTVLDYDDDNLITTETDMQQYSSMRVCPKAYTVNYKRKVAPKVAIAIYRSGATFGYMNPGRQVWLDCSYSDIPHYGMKVWIQGLGGPSDFKLSMSIQVDMNISFKGLR